MSDELKTKSFWERPEGKTGILAILAGGAGLWALGPILIGIFATGITLLGQAITLTILGAILFALWLILSNQKFQNLVGYMFKSAMRKITGAFIEIDPIGIMKSYVEDLRKKRETMEESISALRGQIIVCEKKVNQNAAEFDRQMNTVKVAKDRGMTGQVSVASRQAGRVKKMNEDSYKPMLLQMQVHLRALLKYYEVTGTLIEDMTNEVAAQEDHRKMVMSTYKAMSMAKKILMGAQDREMYDAAQEFLVNDYGAKMGEIENFIENSKSFVEGLDLQNGVYEEEALKRLQEWENSDSILLGNTKGQMLQQTTLASPMHVSIGAPAASDYDQLFKR